MSYAIGSKANTRGRTAGRILCLLCGATVRVFNADVDYGLCRGCRGPRSWDRQAAVLDELEPAVRARMARYVARVPHATRTQYGLARRAAYNALVAARYRVGVPT